MAYKKADDYIEVADRIQEFYARFPEGRLTRKGHPEILELPSRAEKPRVYIVYTAEAYRSPDDELPAVGTAWEPWPGPTPYTKDSEMMNAETSAWGRAIIAAGIPSKKIASKEEVAARTGTSEKESKPTLAQALEGNSLVSQLTKEFDAQEIPAPPAELMNLISNMPADKQLWVLGRGLAKTHGNNFKLRIPTGSSIEKVAAQLRPDELSEAVRCARNFIGKHPEFEPRQQRMSV